MRVMRLLRVLSSPYPIHRKLRAVRNCNSSRGVWGKPSKSSKPSHTRPTATPPPIFRSPPPGDRQPPMPGCIWPVFGAACGGWIRLAVRPLLSHAAAADMARSLGISSAV